jgi:hypothetical protein
MGERKKLDWKHIIEVVESDILPYFNQQGVKPTLRTLFYALYSKGLIPNTKSAYKQLSKQLVKARKNQQFAWDFLEDRTRYTLGNFEDGYVTAADLRACVMRCRERLEDLSLNALLDEMFDWIRLYAETGKWAKQPNIVEIWIEKDALAKTIESWVSDVKIRVNRGYSSWTFIYNNIQEIKSMLEGEHERLIVFYLGDLDPSGVDIQRFLQEAISYFKVDKVVEFKRLAVTDEQVVKYNLPPRPEDAETLRKLERDSRTAGYKHDYIVELDALVVYAPEEFRELLRTEINRYWDEEIYRKVEAKSKRYAQSSRRLIEAIKKKAKKKILEQLKQD